MCMTSNKSTSSGYASPSTLPYHEEESPLPVCQLMSWGNTSASSCVSSSSSASASSASSSSCGAWPIASYPNSGLTPIVSACSSPSGPHSKQQAAKVLSQQRQQRMMTTIRRRNLQELPLPLRKRTCHTPKERFAAFVAILLLHLDGGKQRPRANYKLSLQARALVAECCRRNEMGDIHFSPLQESLSDRLYGLVGQEHWNRARTYLHIYLSRHFDFRPGVDEQPEDLVLLHYPRSTATTAVTTATNTATTAVSNISATARTVSVSSGVGDESSNLCAV